MLDWFEYTNPEPRYGEGHVGPGHFQEDFRDWSRNICRIGDWQLDLDLPYDERMELFEELGRRMLDSGHLKDMCWRDRPVGNMEMVAVCCASQRSIEARVERFQRAVLQWFESREGGIPNGEAADTAIG